MFYSNIMYGVLYMYLVLLLHNSIPCPVKKGSNLNRESINGLLDAAFQNAHNGIAHLKEPLMAATQPAETLSTGNIIRPPEGGTVRLRCKGDIAMAFAGMPDNTTRLSVNGKLVLSTVKETQSPAPKPLVDLCSCLVSSIGEPYYHNVTYVESNPITGSLTFDLPEFSHLHTGKYECLQYNGNRYVVTQTFLVSPTLTASQVFQPPMPNVTVQVGDTARFPCYVKFLAMRGIFKNRFLWRNEDHLLYSEGIDEFRNSKSTKDGFKGSINTATDGICHCYSTLTISRVQAHHAGRYQCWFKVDDLFHEWAVQEAYLSVIT